MSKYKNIRIKKRGGGTRLQRVQVLASGKYKFVKNPSKSSSKRKKKGNPHNNKVRKTGNNKRKPSLLISGAIGLNVLGQWNRNDGAPDILTRAERTGRDFLSSYIAIDPVSGVVDATYLKRGLLPLVIAILVKRFLGKYVSPYLKGMPFSL